MKACLLIEPDSIPIQELTDWGPVAEPIGEPVSHTWGRLLHKAEDGRDEAGVWMCSPGRWRCHIERSEFCHFLSGHTVYTAEDGARFETGPGDAAFFPAGWKGVCEVIQTVRKTYIIR